MSSAGDWTAYTGAAVALLGTAGSFWAWRSKNKDSQDMKNVVSFESLNKALNAEIDRVNEQLAEQKAEYERQIAALKRSNQIQLDEVETRYRDHIKALEADWEQRNTTLRSRMADLESDNASLKRQLIQALRGDHD